MSKILVWDMDGTLVDLYGVPNWKYFLRHEMAAPYIAAEPLFDMVELASLMEEFRRNGWEIQIISWLSKDSSADFKNEVRRAKKNWLDMFGFPYDKFHGVAYGTTKADAIRRSKPEEAILIDDNEKVRKGWHLGRAINPITTDLIITLLEILREEK